NSVPAPHSDQSATRVQGQRERSAAGLFPRLMLLMKQHFTGGAVPDIQCAAEHCLGDATTVRADGHAKRYMLGACVRCRPCLVCDASTHGRCIPKLDFAAKCSDNHIPGVWRERSGSYNMERQAGERIEYQTGLPVIEE